jgi:iron complex outermembrane receptor protein
MKQGFGRCCVAAALLAGLLCSAAVPATAQTPARDLFELSLNELLEVEVRTSSGRPESAREAASVITVIYREQIESAGFDNLYDALNILAGINRVETYFGYTTLNFRGGLQDHYNNKVLFMINDHPLPERTFGSSHLEFLPLAIVERIEVIKGPASALYGTNAMLGVVNVITRDEVPTELRLGLGAERYRQGSLVLGGERFRMALSRQRYDGFPYRGTLDEAGNPVDIDYAQDLDQLYAGGELGSWRWQFGLFDQDKAKFGMNPVVWQTGLSNNRAWFADLGRSWQTGAQRWQARVRVDRFDKDFMAGEFPAPGCCGREDNRSRLVNRVQRIGADFSWRWEASDAYQWTVGYAFDHDDTEPLLFRYVADGSVNPFSPYQWSYDVANHGLFGQLEARLGPQLSGTFGARVENNGDTGASGLLPRLGLVWQPGEPVTVKLLYGEAFRSPGFLEKYADVPLALFGSTGLDNERARTTELSFQFAAQGGWSLQLAAYRLEIDDEIKRRPVSGSVAAEFFNSSGRRVNGLEWAASWQPGPKLRFRVGGDFKTGDEPGLDFLNYTERFTGTAMLEYRLPRDARVTLTGEAVDDRPFQTNDGRRGEVDGYRLLHLNVGVPLGDLGLSFAVLNLFDANYRYPEYVRRNLAEVPGGPGREWRAGLQYRF